jgi:hypothetical protein
MRIPFTSVRLLCLAATAATGSGALVAQEAKPEVPALLLEERAKPKTPATAEQRLLAVGEALAAANAELESLREQHAQVKLQMEALGIAAVKGDERSLQQRLLKATADLRASEKARDELAEHTSRLAEAAAAYMARPGEPALKTALDEAIKAATGAKQSVITEAIPLNAARVVSYKADLGLAVVNAGRDSGIRMGAPMQIYRGERLIASGLVTHVYDRIAGILLTGAAPAEIRVGDSVKPELIQTPPQ